MSILSELNMLFDDLQIPVETGIFSNEAPSQYVVLTPLTDTFDYYADDKPQFDICEVRISLFSQKNYLLTKDRIVNSLLDADFTITQKKYISRDDESGFHNYCIDVEKIYSQERNET